MKSQMNRRRFLEMNVRRLGIAAAGALAINIPKFAMGMGKAADITNALDKHFPRYKKFDPQVPVWCVTPDMDRVIHRFHLSSPFSPSGRYLALTRLAREDSPPKPGEVAEVVLVDLKNGEAKPIAETKGWDTQLGAQVQWGANDAQLFFNDVDTSSWMPYGVVMNPLTGENKKLEWTVYDASPDGKRVVSTCLRRIGMTQGGYGVIVPSESIPRNKGTVDDDGVYVTDVESGKTKMIASYKRIVEEAVPKIDVSRYGPGDFYGFHVKWNSKNERIMLVLRYLPKKDSKYRPQLITIKADGGDIRVAVPASYWADKGGNHPNWLPDGEHVMMNLDIYGKGWRFVQARYDGSELRTMTSVPANHGHPSLHPAGKLILTDAYPREEIAFGDETAPLFLIDLEKEERKMLVRMNTFTRVFTGTGSNPKEMRVDLHPAWDRRTHTLVAFNGVTEGTRRVFVADLSELVQS